MIRKYLLSCLLLFPLCTWGQKTILLETNNTALVLKVQSDKKVYQTYFGTRLKDAGDYENIPESRHQVFIPSGMSDLFEPAIQVLNADGNPSIELHYENYEQKELSENVSLHTITLRDAKYSVEMKLLYEVYKAENIFKAWTSIIHKQKGEVIVKKLSSSMLHLNATEYWLTQFHGDWAEEMKMNEEPLSKGIKTLESKLGSRAHMYQAPLFLVSSGAPASETDGFVIGGTLAWSGNFQFQFEVDERNSLRIISGYNPYASEYHLKPNEKFETPALIFSASENGKGELSRRFHRWGRNYGILSGTEDRSILLNNWEATFFDFNQEKIVDLFKGGQQLGVDVFLLDDGWFGNKYPRDSDKAGLGDWQENKKKIPGGLGYLVTEAGAHGLQFGIWLEPEMVNPKSELYEKHPDWVLALPNREPHYFRNQMVLDLSNPRVQDFVYETVDNVLSSNKGISFVKWDCNRMMTNTYSTYLKKEQSHIYIKYVEGLYSVLNRVRTKYPKLEMMLCSGGGGRVDYGAMKYFTEFWPSDNTDPIERVKMQWGYGYFFPAIATCSHVTSWGDQPLKFKTDVAMSGKLGFDIEVSKLTSDELQFCKQAISDYREISPVVWYGDLFRLISPYEEERAVLLYVSDDQKRAILFSYNLHVPYGHEFTNIKFQGLNPDLKYTFHEINVVSGKSGKFADKNQSFTGDYLMRVGIQLSNNQPVSSNVFELKAE